MHQRALERLASQRRRHRLRKTRPVESAHTIRPVVKGRQCLAFCSNDYLGLANHPEVIDAAVVGLRKYGVGATSASLISGHNEAHRHLESAFAAHIGAQDALLFATGYEANLGVLAGYANRTDTLLCDRLNHASLIDAARLSAAKVKRYRHCCIADLERLHTPAESQHWVVSDGVFSMDGDSAPLNAITAFTQCTRSWLYLDDAHGFGVAGHGKGSLAAAGKAIDSNTLYMATLGKAVGVSGALVGGDADTINAIRQCARTWIFSTAPPPALSCAAARAIRLIFSEEGADRRRRLAHNIALLRTALAEQKWRFLPSCSAIQPLVVGASETACDLSQRLWQQGIWVPAIRPPTVPEGSARLRITLSSEHKPQDLHRLADALQKLQ